MKRRTTPTVRVNIDIDVSEVAKIDFLFKQDFDENCEASVKKTYPTEVTIDENGLFCVELSADETAKFKGRSWLYLDVRPVLKNGKVPATNIVQLNMNPTLYRSDDI